MRLFVLACLPALLGAQNFEVASVRRSGPQSVRGSEGGPGSSDPTRFTYNRARMADLLFWAFPDLHLDAQYIAPDWIRGEGDSYDVRVTMPNGTTKEQAAIMMQNLLAERFQFKFHRETREFQAFEVTIAKSGLKFKESNGAPLPEKPGFPALSSTRPGISLRMTSSPYIGRLAAHDEPVEAVLRILAVYSDLPLIDRTGLTGHYDLMLEFDPAPLAGGDDPKGAPILPVAMEQQLGLKLVQKKLPFEVVVVERIEKNPVDN